MTKEHLPRPFQHKSWFILLIFIPALLMLASCKTPAKVTESGTDKPGKKLTQSEQLQLTALFIDGIREKSLGNNDKALGLFAQCAKRDAAYAPALYEMARILELNSQLPDARAMAIGAVKYEPENEWYQLLLAGIYIKLREYSEAAKIIKLLADKNPQTPDFSSDLANIYLLSGKIQDAIKVYDDIEKRFGVNEESSLQKEKLYLEMGKFNKAITEIENLLRAFPDEVKYMGILAELYLGAGNDIKGLELYQQILKIDPSDPYVHLSLADYYKTINNEQKSFEELCLAFANPALDIDSKVHVLLKYFDRSETDPEAKKQAYQLCKITIETHPTEAKAWSVTGDYYYRDLRFIEARDAFRKVISIDSSKYVVWAQLLIIDSELEDYLSLENESARAMELFPDQAEPYLYNGFANIRLNAYQKAVASLRLGQSFAVEKELILKFQINLGDLLYKMKDYDGSFEAYEKALKTDPENLYVLNNYSFCLALQKRNLSRAEELAKKLNNIEKNKSSYEDTYAWVLFMQEKYSDAKDWLDKALSHDVTPGASVLEHYGDVLFKLNNAAGALEYWIRARNAGADSQILNKKINDKTWYE